MTGQKAPERADQREKRGHGGRESPLQPSRRPDANQLPHKQTKIEACGVNQQSLTNVRVSPQMHPPHPSCFVEVRERPFEGLATKPQQT